MATNKKRPTIGKKTVPSKKHPYTGIAFVSVILLFISIVFTLYVIKQPEALQNHAQSIPQLTLNGTYEVFWRDTGPLLPYQDNRLFSVKIADGTLTPVTFINGNPPDKANTQIQVTGTMQHGELIVDLQQPNAFKVTGANTSATTVSALTPWKVGVILFNFKDDTSKPLTSTQVSAIMSTNADSVTNYFKETSYGKFSLSGKIATTPDIYNWVTIPIVEGTLCQFDNWHTQARDVVQQTAANNLLGYTAFIYLHPAVSTCSFVGLGAINGSDVDINGVANFTTHTIVHELSYGLGVPVGVEDSFITRCTGTVALGPSCAPATGTDFGDPFDPMGYTSGNHYQGYHLARLGWMPQSSVQTVTKSGQYTVAPLEKASSSIQLIRVQRDTSPSSTYIYIDFRQPSGTFDNFKTTDAAVNGVTLHLAPDFNADFGNGKDSYLIDTNPATADGSDAPLLVGKTFTDTKTNISIQTVSVSATNAVVKISIGTPLPSVAPSPSLVPSFVCAGSTSGICLTPTLNPAPSGSGNPSGTTPQPTVFQGGSPVPVVSGTVPPVVSQGAPSSPGAPGSPGVPGGSGTGQPPSNFLQLILQLMALLLGFFLSLFR